MALVWNKTNLLTFAEKKCIELNNICEETIYAGIDVTLSNNQTFHFSLSQNDQINIDSMFSAIMLGAKEYLYHADGQKCTIYSAQDIITIYTTYKTFVTYQTTYCNYAKNYIKSLTDNNKISSFQYGDPLSDSLKQEMDLILNKANIQISNITTSLS